MGRMSHYLSEVPWKPFKYCSDEDSVKNNNNKNPPQLYKFYTSMKEEN